MSATRPDDVYAQVDPAGRTWLRRRPRWRIVIIDGLITYGPAEYGTVVGWLVAGDRARADRFAEARLADYLRRYWSDHQPGAHRVRIPARPSRPR